MLAVYMSMSGRGGLLWRPNLQSGTIGLTWEDDPAGIEGEDKCPPQEKSIGKAVAGHLVSDVSISPPNLRRQRFDAENTSNHQTISPLHRSYSRQDPPL